MEFTMYHTLFGLLISWLWKFVTLVESTELCPSRMEHLRVVHHAPRLHCPVACCGSLTHFYCCDDPTQHSQTTSTVLDTVILCVLLICFFCMTIVVVMVCCSQRKHQKKPVVSECPSAATLTSQMDLTESQAEQTTNHLQVPTPSVFILSDGIYQPPAYSCSPPPLYRQKPLPSPPPPYKLTKSPGTQRRGSWSTGSKEKDGVRKYQTKRRMSIH